MSRFLPALVGALLAVPVLSAEEPRELIEQAVAAQGGLDKLGRAVTVVTRTRGKLFEPVEGLAFTATSITQPGGQRKLTLEAQFGGNRLSRTVVRDGKKGWKLQNGVVEDLTEEELREMDRSAHVERVTALAPLLQEKDFTFEGLGDDKVDGQAVRGVKVKAEGRPDVSLYFSKETHLLVKAAYRDKHPGTGQEAVHEYVVRDYREPVFTQADEETLRAAKVATDGPALLEFLTRRKPQKADEEQIKALIKQLGDDAFAVREKATTALAALGSAAAPLLREAAKSPDAEVARRAERCLQLIGDRVGVAPLVPAAIRLVAVKKPEGAAAVLLDFACRAADEDTAREARAALLAIAVRDGKPDRDLTAALEDKDTARRAAAEAALGKDGGKALKEPGLRLYLDGVKLPMKTTVFIAGKKTLETETVETQYFNRLDDSVFARPK